MLFPLSILLYGLLFEIVLKLYIFWENSITECIFLCDKEVLIWFKFILFYIHNIFELKSVIERRFIYFFFVILLLNCLTECMFLCDKEVSICFTFISFYIHNIFEFKSVFERRFKYCFSFFIWSVYNFGIIGPLKINITILLFSWCSIICSHDYIVEPKVYFHIIVLTLL